jgi:hypothetical protein
MKLTIDVVYTLTHARGPAFEMRGKLAVGQGRYLQVTEHLTAYDTRCFDYDRHADRVRVTDTSFFDHLCRSMERKLFRELERSCHSSVGLGGRVV